MKHRKPDTNETLLMKRLAAMVALGGGVTIPILTATDASAASQEQWERIAACESGDMNTPGSGQWNLSFGDASSTGGLQIQQTTWDGFGGQEFASQPFLATREQQIEVAERILASQGAGAWVCNNPGHGIATGALGAGTGQSSLNGGPAPFEQQQEEPPEAPEPPPAEEQQQVPPQTARTYTVQPGDWLMKIAREQGMDDWQELYRINRAVIGNDPNLVQPGTELALPGTQSQEPAAGFSKPVEGIVTQSFGNPASYYTLGYHTGLDVAAPMGTEVHAPTDGTVVVSDPSSPYGTNVQVQHSDGKYTLYAHLSGRAVHAGDTVAPGDVIGFVGTSGTQSTGPHLHMEVRLQPNFAAGGFLDPRKWLQENGISY